MAGFASGQHETTAAGGDEMQSKPKRSGRELLLMDNL